MFGIEKCAVYINGKQPDVWVHYGIILHPARN